MDKKREYVEEHVA